MTATKNVSGLCGEVATAINMIITFCRDRFEIMSLVIRVSLTRIDFLFN